MVLVKGMSGASVGRLQENLILLGFGKLLGKHGKDDVYGKDTFNTVKKFQSWAGIEVDGKAGNETDQAVSLCKIRAGKNGTYNFNIDEFRCKGTGKMLSGGMDNDLLLKLEKLRYELGNKPIIINSGYRTPGHNKSVGGVSNSQHLYGRASDIKIHGVSPSTVYNVADKIFSNNGVGKYDRFTHVDTRNYKARF